jgi:hypothetical protein
MGTGVFDPFHWVFSEEKEGKERKRKRLWENYINSLPLLCNLMFLQLNNHFHQCTLYITMSSIDSRATTLCSAILPLSTLQHPLTCPHFLQGTVYTSGQCKISLLPGQFVLKQQWHLRTVDHFCYSLTFTLYFWLTKLKNQDFKNYGRKIFNITRLAMVIQQYFKAVTK